MRDRVVEEDGVLRDHPDLGAERPQGHVADIDTVDQDGARRDVEEAGNEIDERRLARSAGADDRDHLAGLHRERHALENLPAVLIVVLKTDVPELDLASERRERTRGRAVEDLRMDLEHLEDAFGRGDRLVQRRVDTTQFLDRRVHHERGKQEPREVAGRQLSTRDLAAAVPQGSHDGEAAERTP